MTDPTPLSPAAQAVLDAFGTYPLRADHISEDLILALAAALRAAADQVVPRKQSTHRPPGPLVTGDILWDDSTASILRRNILAIATELEDHA